MKLWDADAVVVNVMAMRFQAPNGPYGYAPAVPVQSLLAQVLGITALGLLITAGAAYVFQNVSYGVGLVSLIAGFIVLIAINATRANEALSLTLFYLFAALEGIGLAPTLHAYAVSIGSGVIVDAAATTGLGMLALACVVYVTGLDLRRFQGYVFLALIGLVLVGVFSAFTHWVHPATYAWLTLVIFTALVLIDFARIRAGGSGFTPVQLAVQIYLDAINIFLALLQLFGGRRRND
ncbi:MAG TPA: Bax inhibitor-1 family protein [Candidatus Baltobacteraceae bacterium]|jgi:modulator of FtsH protease|nr:Bax inhibitor-1 family protein [Candidatus Baltobacteraceae bacterium]